jgi:DNA repair exonuclease SbcCD nuclease subunit
MKIAFLTDLHLEEDPGTGDIYEIQMDGLAQLVEDIGDADPDLILLGGDNSGPAPPYKSSPAERNAHIELRQTLAEIAPVIEVQGNHDYPGDYEVFNKIKSQKPIVFVSEPSAVDCARTPGMGDLECVVWCLPWVFASDAGDEDHLEYTKSIAQDVVEEAIAQRKRDAAAKMRREHFLLGHAAINGALLREGQPRVPVEDPVLDPDMLMPMRGKKKQHPLFDAAFFGHYHHRQVVKTDGAGNPIGIYGGSVFIRTFGEDLDKGWCLYDSDARSFSFETIEQPGKLTIVYNPEKDRVVDIRPDLGIEFDSVADYDFSEIEVKMVVLMPKAGLGEHIGCLEATRAAIARTARSIEMAYEGEAEAKTREGAAEIAKAKTLEDKIEYYLTHRAPEKPSEEEVAEAIALFKRIRAKVDRRSGS